MNIQDFISKVKFLAKQVNWSLRGSIPVSRIERLLNKLSLLERTNIQVTEDENKLNSFLGNWPTVNSDKVKVSKDLVVHFESKYKLIDSKNFSKFLPLGLCLGVTFGVVFRKIALGIFFAPMIGVLLTLLDNIKKDKSKLY